MTWVKICGTTSVADAQLAISAGADALGFIFAPSPRRLTQEAAAEIIEALPQQVAKIGVTVNQSPDELAELARNVGLTAVQLQGNERSGQLCAYRSALQPLTIIKTLQASSVLEGGNDYLDQYLGVSEFFDAVLLDSGSATQPGGTGTPFDWSRLLSFVSRIKETMPVIIAGGLNAKNAADAIRLFQPWGVDVASGVESAPGKKDEAKLRAFVETVRAADHNERKEHTARA
jgi:phosphoribosylanthranilate isomerase